MRRPIVMPDVGAPATAAAGQTHDASAIDAGLTGAMLHLWFVEPGEPVYAGDRLIEVLLEGATVDISSPATGRLAEKAARAGERVVTGQVLGYVEEEGE